MLRSFYLYPPTQLGLLRNDEKSHSGCWLESKFEEGKIRDKDTGQQSIVKLEVRDGGGLGKWRREMSRFVKRSYFKIIRI